MVILKAWFSVDPKAYAFPTVSPYTFNMNNPVMFIDPGGDSTIYIVNYGLNSNDAQFVKNEIKSILEKNDLTGLKYEVISPEQAKGLKLNVTDAIISLRNDNELSMKDQGNTAVDGLFQDSQNDETNKNTFVNLNTLALIGRMYDKESQLYAISYMASHEIVHQLKEKANIYFFNSMSIDYLSGDGGHDNSNVNLNSDGKMTPIPLNKSKFIRPAETLNRCDQNIIKAFLNKHGIN